MELILIRNDQVGENSKNKLRSILVLRIHHVMGDAKSLLKLLVECLGNKQLQTAIPQYISETRWDYLKFVLSFPYKSVYETFRTVRLLYKSFDHPLKLHGWCLNPNLERNKTVVTCSSKISISNLKHVAFQYNVKTSAVVMSIIAGAVQQICGENWNKPVAIGYMLPKPNHPETLTNYLYACTLNLPTDEQCRQKRLQRCNQKFIKLKEEKKGRYLDAGLFLAGFVPFPINRIFGKILLPIGITNNAGEKEGFSVGNAQCIDYRMSVGTTRGATGVVFCTVSYQDGMRIAVIGKESICSKEMAEDLAKHIQSELQFLMNKPITL